MDDPVLWVALLLLTGVLLLASTISSVLRMPSRARLGDVLTKAGRESELTKLVEALPELILANGVLRSGSTVAIVLVVFALVERHTDAPSWTQYAEAFATAWALGLIFGVAIPTAWARYSGEGLLAFLLPVLHVLRVILTPLVVLLQPFDGLVRRLAGVPLQTAQSQAAELEREILNVVSEGEIHGAVDGEEKDMIESIIELRATPVEAIMTPRTEMVAAEKGIGLAEVKRLIAESGHSRIPVFDETIDTVLGVLYAKDLLDLSPDEPFDATRVMRGGIFVPETKLLRDLLHQFQEQKVHLAIVLDEYGGTAGLITIEDILEELVGEIVDEYESEEPAAIRRIDGTTVEVDARMRLGDLNDELHLGLPEDEDYETIGGFVFSTLGRIPKVGEVCEHGHVSLQVIGAEARRITRLRLRIAPLNGDRPDNGA